MSIATEYEEEILRDAENNPPFPIGCMVSVYRHIEGKPLLGTGRILKTEWSRFYYQHVCKVMMFNTGTVQEYILSSDMNRVCFSGSIQFAMLKEWTRQCNF